MKGLPSGPVTLPVMVAPNALEAKTTVNVQTVNVREARTLSAESLSAKDMIAPVGPRSSDEFAGV
jgi:hypothetical protein